MSFLKRLLGSASFAERLAEAEALVEQGEHGRAKLAFERALDAGKEQPEASRQAVAEQIDTCCDALARASLEEGNRLLEEGQLDFAMLEFEGALETGRSPELLERVRGRIEQAQRADVRDAMGEQEQSDDDRFETLAGSWEQEQYEEYTALGEAFRDAVLALDSGEIADARAALEDLIAQTDDAHYLWFELGRARLLDGDGPGAEEGLSRFVASVGPDEGGDARLVAHMELAGQAQQREDFDSAVAQYQAALEAMPDDPRPYLAMGMFFRHSKLSEEAADVLESGLEMMGDGRPEWRLWQELGLARADQGKIQDAMGLLEQVIEFFASHHLDDLPPASAMKLAELYEEQGNLARALDMHASLAAGSDRARLHLHHFHAGRLMTRLEFPADARRMLVRARELLVEGDPLGPQVDTLLAELDGGQCT